MDGRELGAANLTGPTLFLILKNDVFVLFSNGLGAWLGGSWQLGTHLSKSEHPRTDRLDSSELEKRPVPNSTLLGLFPNPDVHAHEHAWHRKLADSTRRNRFSDAAT